MIGGGEGLSYDNNNEPVIKKKRGRKKKKLTEFPDPYGHGLNGFMDGAFGGMGPPGMDPGANQSKTKRARTSFKHHQLRIMKSHFQQNQNPDSKELKMLSQSTGLEKKVLQVSE